jgi:hypothetical protein
MGPNLLIEFLVSPSPFHLMPRFPASSSGSQWRC